MPSESHPPWLTHSGTKKGADLEAEVTELRRQLEEQGRALSEALDAKAQAVAEAVDLRLRLQALEEETARKAAEVRLRPRLKAKLSEDGSLKASALESKEDGTMAEPKVRTVRIVRKVVRKVAPAADAAEPAAAEAAEIADAPKRVVRLVRRVKKAPAPVSEPLEVCQQQVSQQPVETTAPEPAEEPEMKVDVNAATEEDVHGQEQTDMAHEQPASPIDEACLGSEVLSSAATESTEFCRSDTGTSFSTAPSDAGSTAEVVGQARSEVKSQAQQKAAARIAAVMKDRARQEAERQEELRRTKAKREAQRERELEQEALDREQRRLENEAAELRRAQERAIVEEAERERSRLRAERRKKTAEQRQKHAEERARLPPEDFAALQLLRAEANGETIELDAHTDEDLDEDELLEREMLRVSREELTLKPVAEEKSAPRDITELIMLTAGLPYSSQGSQAVLKAKQRAALKERLQEKRELSSITRASGVRRTRR